MPLRGETKVASGSVRNVVTHSVHCGIREFIITLVREAEVEEDSYDVVIVYSIWKVLTTLTMVLPGILTVDSTSLLLWSLMDGGNISP